MNKALTFITGASLGSGLMFLLDPDRGRRRRAVVRDKVSGTWRDTGHVLRRKSRDLGNRAQGMAASTRSLFGRAPDRDALVDRVRSKIGRAVSHPHAIHVTEQEGRIVVSGPVLAAELSGLLKAVRRVKGVESVENRLDVHDTGENVPELVGGHIRAMNARRNWQTVASVAGGAIAAYSLVSNGRANRGLRALVRAVRNVA
jgi:hypothetical protein